MTKAARRHVLSSAWTASTSATPAQRMSMSAFSTWRISELPMRPGVSRVGPSRNDNLRKHEGERTVVEPISIPMKERWIAKVGAQAKRRRTLRPRGRPRTGRSRRRAGQSQGTPAGWPTRRPPAGSAWMAMAIDDCPLMRLPWLGGRSIPARSGSSFTLRVPPLHPAPAHGDPLPGGTVSPSLTSANPTPAIETRCTAGWFRSTPAPPRRGSQTNVKVGLSKANGLATCRSGRANVRAVDTGGPTSDASVGWGLPVDLLHRLPV